MAGQAFQWFCIEVNLVAFEIKPSQRMIIKFQRFPGWVKITTLVITVAVRAPPHLFNTGMGPFIRQNLSLDLFVASNTQ